MSLHHQPPVILPADFPLINAPLLGGELKALFSAQNAVELGKFVVTGSNAGTWTPSAPGLAMLAAQPMDIIVVSDNGLHDGGATDLVIKVSGTDNATTVFTTQNASFALPSWALNQTRSFQKCLGVDLVIGSGLPVATVTAVTVVCAAEAVNSVFKLFAVPALSTFQQIGCVTEKDFNLKTQDAVPIRCGLDPSAFVKPGDLQVGNVSITANSQNDLNGFARYVGRPVTVMLEARRENRLVTDRYYFLRCTAGIKKKGPEGAASVTDSIEGIAEETVFMIAPTS